MAKKIKVDTTEWAACKEALQAKKAELAGIQKREESFKAELEEHQAAADLAEKKKKEILHTHLLTGDTASLEIARQEAADLALVTVEGSEMLFGLQEKKKEIETEIAVLNQKLLLCRRQTYRKFFMQSKEGSDGKELLKAYVAFCEMNGSLRARVDFFLNAFYPDLIYKMSSIEASRPTKAELDSEIFGE